MPSSVVASYLYNRELSVLSITFTSGVIYEYLDVPPSTYEAFKAFREKGIFLNKEIKGKFSFRKVYKKD